jgi:hypothetical protein
LYKDQCERVEKEAKQTREIGRQRDGSFRRDGDQTLVKEALL